MAPPRRTSYDAERAPFVTIRYAQLKDAPRIADLCGQLGYPATNEEIRQRLRILKPPSRHAVFVAISTDGNLIGWLHVSVTPLLETALRAEVNGLVIDAHQRSLGAGAKLLRVAEKWAQTRRCLGMSVRSNVLRDRAHSFYVGNGYEHYKTQKAFHKKL
jgi:ribosomal protein S18 acetylase RimI-like enzyme